MIRSLTQRHLLPVVTPAAILTGVGRIDFDQLSASFFRFAGQFAEEFRPRGICNAFCKAMVMGHAVHVKVFYRNHPETVDDLPRRLVSEVVTSERNPFMDSCDGLTVCASLRSTRRERAMPTINFGKGLFLFPEKARVRNLFPVGKSSK